MKPWHALALLLSCMAATACASGAHRVASLADPALAFRVDPALAALPPMRFPIEGKTDADRRLFVEARDGVVRRMLVLQFETVQPGSDFRFVFPPKPPRSLGPDVYRSGAYAYDDVLAAERAPGLEAARTRAALLQHGLQPARYWHVARLARVADPAGMHEVIVFYMENADARYPQGLVNVDEDGDGLLDAAETARLWRALEASVEARPLAAR
ncbi:MAG: hypothetical protein QM719_05660 [Thermomonas sp.]